MNKRLLSMMTILLAVALVPGCLDPKENIQGNTFSTTYADPFGKIDAQVQVNQWDLSPGQTLALSYDFRVAFSSMMSSEAKKEIKGVWVVWYGERLFNSKGRYRSMVNALSSTSLTPTGIAIETNQAFPPSRKIGYVYGTPFDETRYFPLGEDLRIDDLRLTGSWERPLDETVPEGLYRIGFNLLFETQTRGRVPWAFPLFAGDREPRLITSRTLNPNTFTAITSGLYPHRSIPMVQIGKVERPQMPWILFPTVRANGNAGLVANEDNDRFALSTRLRHPGKFIIEPTTLPIEPCLITQFPRAANPDDMAGAGLVQSQSPHFLDFEDGQVAVRVVGPDGRTHPLGTRRFVGKGKFGPALEGGPFRFDFLQWGKHTIIMNGTIRDRLGRTIEGGGTYDVWVGRWMTFSTTVKHGKNFEVGNRFPFKMEVNPPFPAQVTLTVDYYPLSDRSKKQQVVVHGVANEYGYFRSSTDDPSLLFDQPGEYRVEFFSTYKTPDGAHWYGDQVAVGIIEGATSRIRLHGMRLSDPADMLAPPEQETLPLARYALQDESTRTLSMLDMVDCYDLAIPFYTGDVLFTSATFSRFANITSYLSMEPKDPALRKALVQAYPPTPLLSTGFDSGKSDDEPDIGIWPMRLDATLNVTYFIRDDEQADMFPFLSQNASGYHPYLFPETNTVETYAYFNAIRPGFSTFVMTSDANPIGSYWATSPNTFGGQLNAGTNGDMPGDLYQVTAGLVYKDLVNQTVDYASYKSTIVITEKGTNNNRVVSPCSEPLFTANGKDHWLILAMATTTILTAGDRISLGCEVFPAVPAEIETSFAWPDGRVEQVTGQANHQGDFAGKVFTVDQPGVYRVKATASYLGKTGNVLGSGDGVFHHYVVEKGHPDILEIDLPTISPYDLTRILEIPIRIREGYTDPVITYSAITPGIVLDEATFYPEGQGMTHRFIPSQFAMQFSNFDILDYGRNQPNLEDTVVLVFFVEATAPDGGKVHDARRILIRKNTLYNFKPARMPR